MNIRKAILTGGGRGTRLHPITQKRNKHLLPIANKPMIFHAIEAAVDAGIEEIYINLNPGETELQKHVGDGGHWGIDVKYFEQTGGPQGLAHVVKQGEDHVQDEPFLFYLSDNIFLEGISQLVEKFESGDYDCMVALSEVEDPSRYGVPEFHEEEDKIVDVHEKPSNPPSNFAVTGAYVYGSNIFFRAYDKIEKSARGEYEISDIHSHFLEQGKKIGYQEVTGWWTDTGKPPALLEANKMILDDMEHEEFPTSGMVSDEAEIKGKVHIGSGTRVKENVEIEGPVIIGENCVLENCRIGPYVTIGTGIEIKEATFANSVVLDNSEIAIDMDITGSLLGEKVKLTHKQQQREKAKKMLLGDKTEIEL
jgi:glucose-1-phosphate thymidylyltransferase